MSGFGCGGNPFKDGITGGDFMGGLFDDRPILEDKIKMLLTDVETEGEKRGYEKASKEYDVAYKEIEKQFKETEAFFENQKNIYDYQANQLLDYLEILEKKHEYLEKQVELKTNAVSMKYSIPIDIIKRSMAEGSLFTGVYHTVDILDLIYSYKEKKLRQAEQKGYEEARILFDKKLQKLKDELKKLKEHGDREIDTLSKTNSQIRGDIFELEIKNSVLEIKSAELQILL